MQVPTYEEIQSMIQDALKSRAGITNFSDSSIAGTLVNVVADLMVDLYTRLAELDSQTSLDTAYGSYLDKIGSMFGVTRLSSKTATTLGTGRSILFTNTGGLDIIVPSGTRIWSSSDFSKAYITVADTLVPKADDYGVPGRVYVDAYAAGTGTYYNVRKGELDSHNVGITGLTVTNVVPITAGQDSESDSNYVFRIKNTLLARSGNNSTTLRLALLEIPGVKDVSIIEYARGAGTVDAVIIPAGDKVTADLLNACQTAAEEAVAAGISVKIKAPVEIPVDFSILLNVNSTADYDSVKSLVISAISTYVDNLPLGDETYEGNLIISEVIRAAMDASSAVIDVSIQNMLINGEESNIVNQTAMPGERFYVQSVEVL